MITILIYTQYSMNNLFICYHAGVDGGGGAAGGVVVLW